MSGSGFAADRFKRVHELAVHWYQGEWRGLHLTPPVESGHRRIRAGRRANGTPHTGEVAASQYDSTERITRSVIFARSDPRRVHPTQKPVGIIRPLVEDSCPLGGLVLDPFVGSGTSLLAAREVGRRAIGIEINEGYCAAAVERLAQRDLLSEGAAA
jgi:site-specific DNA-methyltransferase (adenine-specific)